MSSIPSGVQTAIDDLIAQRDERLVPDAGKLGLVLHWCDVGSDAPRIPLGGARVGASLEREAENWTDEDLCDYLDEDDDFPVDDEMRTEFVRCWLVSIVNGETDLGENPSFRTVALTSRDRRRAVLGLQLTDSDSGVDIKCCGLFAATASFHRWLRSTGWLTCADDVHELIDATILSWWNRGYGPDYSNPGNRVQP